MWLALPGLPRPFPPRCAWLQQRSFPPTACCCLAAQRDSDLLRLLRQPALGLRLAPSPAGSRGCGPLTPCGLPCATVSCPSMPSPLRRGVLRGCLSSVFTSAMACASRERLGPPWPLPGSHHDAAGCTSCDGRLGCTPFPGGDAASAPSVAHEHWEPAPWHSGASHDRTCTGKQTVTFKAHHARVRPGFG